MSSPVHVKNDLTRVVLALLVLGALIGGSFWILRPFLPALVWATMIVIATWPMMKRVQAWFFGRRSLAVAVMTLAFLLLIAAPVGYGTAAIFDYLPGVSERLQNMTAIEIPPPPDWLVGLPLVGDSLASLWRAAADRGPGGLFRQIVPYIGTIGQWLLREIGGFGLFIVQLLLTLALTAILYTSGESAAAGMHRFAARLAGAPGTRAVTLAAQSIRAVALGIIVTAVVQSVLGGIGLAIAGVPYAMALTALMFVLCIAQIGPIPLLVSAVGWLYWKDASTAAIGLLIWTAVVGSLDNFLRPMLIRRGADLPLILIMAGVIGGLVAFGLIGLFVGPVILAVSYRLLQAWMDDSLEVETPRPADDRDPPASGAS